MSRVPSRSISAIHTALGNAAAMRTPTVCCDSISHAEQISHASRKPAHRSGNAAAYQDREQQSERGRKGCHDNGGGLNRSVQHRL